MNRYFFIIINFFWILNGLESNELPYQAIVFDFGGVVAHTDRDTVREFLTKYFEISKIAASNLYHDWRHAIAKGKEEQQFWTEYAEGAKQPLAGNWLEQWEVVKLSGVKPITGVLAIIDNLKQQGYRVAMLSNVTKEHAELIQKLGYYKLFHPLLLSYEIGARKPDPRAYEILLLALNLPAKKCLFIDDKLTNVRAAKNCGMDAIIFISTPQLQRELLHRGINLKAVFYQNSLLK